MFNNNESELIYYFLIANVSTGKEIGSFIDNYAASNTINEFDEIISISKEILQSPSTKFKRNEKGKHELKNHNIYFTTTNKGTFYLAAVKKTSKYCHNENLIFELIEDIEHQGIKKLVDKNGELTNVGKQNLKFSIEKYQESNRNKLNSPLLLEPQQEIEQFNVTQPLNKINSINTEINDLKKDMTQSVQTMVSNMNDMEDMAIKSEKIKDISLQFKNDSAKLERKMLWEKYKMKIIIGLVVLTVIIIIIISILI